MLIACVIPFVTTGSEVDLPVKELFFANCSFFHACLKAGIPKEGA